VLAPFWVALRGPVPIVAPSLRLRVLLVVAIAANWAWLVLTGV
jgi:hypothetical protein